MYGNIIDNQFSIFNQKTFLDPHSGPENLKKVQAKKLLKSNKSIFFSWNCIFGSFKLFPSSKIDFWPFLKLQKWNSAKKNNSWNWFIWFHKFFWPGLFLNFLAHCAAVFLNCTFFEFLAHCVYYLFVYLGALKLCGERALD